MGLIFDRPPTARERLKSDNALGSISLVIDGTATVTGDIEIAGRVFRFSPLGDGDHAISEVKGTASAEEGENSKGREQRVSIPGLPGAEAGNVHTSWLSQSTSTAVRCAVEIQRVLILYTSGAAAGRNILASANQMIADANATYWNSGIQNLSLELASLAAAPQSLLDQFANRSTPNIALDLDDLQQNGNVASLRNSASADMVMLLVEPDRYGPNMLGKAGSIGGNESLAFAITDVEDAEYLYSFAHELGHLQGGGHAPYQSSWGLNPKFPSTGNAHQFTAEGSHYGTLMASIESGYTRIRYLSDPYISYRGTPTGLITPGSGFTRAEVDRYNKWGISVMVPTVADFRVPNELRTSVTSSPYNSGGNYTFEALPCGGTGTLTYEWRESYDYGNTYNHLVGTGQTYSTYLYPGEEVYLKVTVYDATGQQANAYAYAQEFDPCSGNPYCYGAQDDGVISSDGTRRARQSPDFEFYGLRTNPVKLGGTGHYRFSLQEMAEVSVQVFDVTGRQVKSVDLGQLTAGAYARDLDLASLASGAYLLRFQAGSFVETSPFVITP